MIGAVTDRLNRARTVISRATLVPLLVRGGIGLSLLLAMAVAWPADVVAGRFGLPLMVVALYPAIAPRGRGTTVAYVVAVAGWIVDTTGPDGRVVLWRVIALASLLYIGHTLAALAAALPYDGVINLDVVTLWLARALGVVLISAVLTVIALGLAEALAGGAFVIATLVGLAAAAAATLLLTRLLRR
jgi:hypothetical protein